MLLNNSLGNVVNDRGLEPLCIIYNKEYDFKMPILS